MNTCILLEYTAKGEYNGIQCILPLLFSYQLTSPQSLIAPRYLVWPRADCSGAPSSCFLAARLPTPPCFPELPELILRLTSDLELKLL